MPDARPVPPPRHDAPTDPIVIAQQLVLEYEQLMASAQRADGLHAALYPFYRAPIPIQSLYEMISAHPLVIFAKGLSDGFSHGVFSGAMQRADGCEKFDARFCKVPMSYLPAPAPRTPPPATERIDPDDLPEGYERWHGLVRCLGCKATANKHGFLTHDTHDKGCTTLALRSPPTR